MSPYSHRLCVYSLPGQLFCTRRPGAPTPPDRLSAGRDRPLRASAFNVSCGLGCRGVFIAFAIASSFFTGRARWVNWGIDMPFRPDRASPQAAGTGPITTTFCGSPSFSTHRQQNAERHAHRGRNMAPGAAGMRSLGQQIGRDTHRRRDPKHKTGQTKVFRLTLINRWEHLHREFSIVTLFWVRPPLDKVSRSRAGYFPPSAPNIPAGRGLW